MRRAAIIVLLAGCASTSARDDLEARLVQLEVQVSALERRLDDPEALQRRVEAIEAVLKVPPPTADANLEARIAALEAQVAELRAQPHAPPPAPQPRAGDGGATLVPGAPPGMVAVQDGPVEVLSAGSGALLLVRTKSGGLQRVQLLGVEAPERAEVYAEQPALRARHVEAFGAQVVTDDAAFDASRQHLESLVFGQVTLSSTEMREGQPPAAVVRVTRADGTQVDVNEAMVRDGFALPRPGHARAPEFDALAAEARAQRRGLFARP